MEKKVFKNYLFNASYQLLALIVPLVTTPYISRVLGASGIGVNSYTYSIVSYFILCATLGTATYGNRIFGILQDNVEERSRRFWDIFLLRVILSSISLSLYLIYVCFSAENKIIALIQGIYILGAMFDISWFFQGLEEFKKIAIRNYFIKIINVVCIFVFVKQSEDLWKYIFMLAFLTFIGNLSIWIYIPKYIIKINKYKSNPFKDFKAIIQLFIPTVAVQIYAILDKSMIGWFTKSSFENGYYEQSEKIVKMCLMLITSLSTVMIPRISKAFIEKRKQDVLEEIYKSYKFVWFLSVPLMLGLIGIAPIFVPIFFGEGFEKVNILLPIFSLLFITMGLNSTTGNQYLITTAQQNVYTKCIIGGGIVNIVLNIFLIPLYQSIGSAIASVAGELSITVLTMIYISRHNQFSIKKIFKLSKKYALAGIIMFIVISLLRICMEETAFSLLILIIIGIIIYFSTLLIIKEDFLISGISIFKRKIKKLM